MNLVIGHDKKLKREKAVSIARAIIRHPPILLLDGMSTDVQLTSPLLRG